MEGQKALGFDELPEMNKGLTGLERHESESLMTYFSFLGELTL